MTMTRKQQLQANNAAVQAAIQKMNNIHMRSIDALYDNLPYDFSGGVAVMLGDEIHLIGGTVDTTRRYHYAWTGIMWESISTLPYDFYYGCVLVYNNQIHMLGGNGNPTGHYSFDGSAWNIVSTLPTNMSAGKGIVLNNEIHIFANNDHYKWNGSAWTKVSVLQPAFNYGCVVEKDGDIYLIGGNQATTTFRKWSGGNWTTLPNIPYPFYYGAAQVIDGEIHIYGGLDTANYKNHYVYKQDQWFVQTAMKMDFTNGSSVLIDNTTRILGGTKNPRMHYAPNQIIYV